MVVPPLREQIDERLGKPVALSTIYRMLARNGWRLTRPLPREILRRVRTGKKLQGNLDQIVVSWNNDRPLRLMSQDEARFGRIPDTRYCWYRRPVRPLVYAMVTQQYTDAYGAVTAIAYPPGQTALLLDSQNALVAGSDLSRHS